MPAAVKYRLRSLNDLKVLDIDEELELRAMVASGDCFDLIASRLDQIMRLSNDKAARPELEHVIRLLIHLQARYKIVSKPPAQPIVV